MRHLTVLYDARCGFCGRCREWLEGQPKLLAMEFIPAGSRHARDRFPTLAHPDPPEELVVIDDEGGVYRGADAWILCLYALEDYRAWSVRLARPRLRPLARQAFEWLSRNRKALSSRLGLVPDETIAAQLEPMPAPSCGIDGMFSTEPRRRS
jgi:predicted DCC family thiol-disulfide oxidoreductase YuxK